MRASAFDGAVANASRFFVRCCRRTLGPKEKSRREEMLEGIPPRRLTLNGPPGTPGCPFPVIRQLGYRSCAWQRCANSRLLQTVDHTKWQGKNKAHITERRFAPRRRRSNVAPQMAYNAEMTAKWTPSPIPTPDEIRIACAAIRATWSEAEHRRRARAVPILLNDAPASLTYVIPLVKPKTTL